MYKINVFTASNYLVNGYNNCIQYNIKLTELHATITVIG